MNRYMFYIAIAVDQLLNAILGGYPDETLSARCWRENRWQRYVIDGIFFWQRQDGKGHCEQCYEYEQKRMDMPKEYRTIKVTNLDIFIDEHTKIIYHDKPAEK